MTVVVPSTTTALEKLPVVVYKSDAVPIWPRKDPVAFIAHDLDLARLNEMAAHGLWLAGRVGNIRPLHKQLSMGRTIVITEQMDLHLLWKDEKLFIKPLGAYHLDTSFSHQYIEPYTVLLEAANGFLLSYSRLIIYESDFDVAKTCRLLPPDMVWADWTHLVDTRISALLEQHYRHVLVCAPRFRFGELRLGRVNKLYRYHPMYRLRNLARGYYDKSTTFETFLRGNFAWLIAFFAYITIILTAMQVGLTTNQLQQSHRFNLISSAFVVFSITVTLAAGCAAFILIIVLTIYHVQATVQHMHNNGFQASIFRNRSCGRRL